MAQTVEHLSSKCEALSNPSNPLCPSPPSKKKKRENVIPIEKFEWKKLYGKKNSI
jgi:hypothetical protein